ncbi:MAG: glutamyl-tRNA reductase, partial [Flammeovirgaceae bacterium]
FVSLNNTKDAIEHLFRVALGLESQVVGDLQISNQVKRAYQWTADHNMAGPFLHRLLHSIFFTNKRVVQETAFRDGAASVSYAAVEMLEELVQDFVNPRVLVIGLGEIGADVVRNLQHTEITEVIITNRTALKADLLAKECGYESLPFEKVWEEAEKADAIICSIGLKEPFFSVERVKQFNILSHKCFLDLAVPRSIEAGMEEQVPGAIVYNIDDINNRASEALEKRKKAIPHVEDIIGEAIHDFEEWAKNMVFSPIIQNLKDSLEQIRQEEMKKFLKKFNDQEVKAAEAISKSIIQKIIKQHVLKFKAACKRGEAEELADMLRDLFDLEGSKVEKK